MPGGVHGVAQAGSGQGCSENTVRLRDVHPVTEAGRRLGTEVGIEPVWSPRAGGRKFHVKEMVTLF